MLISLTRFSPLLPYMAIATEVTSSVASDGFSAFAPLINVGAIGCVLLWFLLRAEPRFKNIEEAIDRQSRAILLVTIAIQGVPQYVKEQASGIVGEIEAQKK